MAVIHNSGLILKNFFFDVGKESGLEPEPTSKPTTSIPGLGAIGTAIALTLVVIALIWKRK